MYSFAGNRNFGDDYIAGQWIKYNEAAGFGKKIIFSSESGWLQAYHLEDNVIFNNFIPAALAARTRGLKQSRNVDKLTEVDMIAAGQEAADQLVDNLQWRNVISRISSLHMCGGGYLNSIFPHSYGIAALFQRLSERLSVPLYGTGLGLLPIASPIPELTRVFKGFEVIECRDQESSKMLEETWGLTNACLGSDDTFLLPVTTIVQPSRRPVLYLNLQSDSNTHHVQKMLDKVKPIVKSMEGGLDIHYLHFFQNSDGRYLKHITDQLPVSVIYSKEQLYSAGLPFMPADFCITTRFHLHLLASRVGLKGGFIAGRPGYYDIKHSSITGLGSNWVDIMNFDCEQDRFGRLPPPEIDERLLMSNKQKLAQKILQ